MATVTTIYTGDELNVGEVRKLSGVDFTTWSAEGSWRGVAEPSRVWVLIGSGPLRPKLLIGALTTLARKAGESAILVTTSEVASDLVTL